jgi:D-threo-aldose 1-dehydrogenase
MKLPKTIFGTSSLGNLFVELDFNTKKEIIHQIMLHSAEPVIFDSAGKYGAGLALESLSQCLQVLNVSPKNIRISNKLGWKQVPLTTAEPTFEPGAWVNLSHDAVQDISYQGILDCYFQGEKLLGNYHASMVSVHDPDEYIASARNEKELESHKENLLKAYSALKELKDQGEVEAIGIGAKNTSVIDFVSDHFKLDWAMFACSVTPYTHTESTKRLLKKLKKQKVPVINSAVFHAGFLTGGEFFDYEKISRKTHPEIFQWRETFNQLCQQHNISPAAACVQFSFLFEEICSVALNTSSPQRVKGNIELANTPIPEDFWRSLKDAKLTNI